jgi:hypothetical protein
MKDEIFWDRVKHGCEMKKIPDGTFKVWKHRGRVSREQQIPIFQVLAGTEYEIPLDEFSKRRKSTH